MGRLIVKLSKEEAEYLTLLLTDLDRGPHTEQTRTLSDGVFTAAMYALKEHTYEDN